MTTTEAPRQGKTNSIGLGPRIWASPLEGLGFVTILLFLLGAINVFSASFVMGSQLLGDSLYFLKRHLLATILGLIGMAGVIRQGYRWILDKLSLWTIFTIVLLGAVYFIGVEANGAKRWLSIGGMFTFQPSEMAKLIAVLAASAYVGPRLDRRSVSLLSYPMLLAVVMALMVTMQPDMGTGAIIGGMCLVPYLVAGIPRREWAALIVLGVGGMALLISRYAYRSERVWAWLNPAAYAQTSGYQPTQSLLAIGSGGLKGTGLGMGASKFYYLPEAHTDFIFPTIGEELGLVFTLLIVFCYVVMIISGIAIALNARERFGTLLGVGITTMLALQAALNIGVTTALLPNKGIPLPFISYGGSNLLFCMLGVGILLNIYRNGGLEKATRAVTKHRPLMTPRI